MDVDLVLVPVTVTDWLGRVVTGLERNHFQVFEDKVPQRIASFSSEDVPVSVGVVFDLSGSMSNKLQKARMAALQFFKASNPQDEFTLIGFNDQPLLLCDFTPDVAQLLNKLTFAGAKGRTSLLDAVYLAVSHMRHGQHGRKALLIISDGGDNYSRYTEAEVKELVKESDVQIYAIGIFDPYLYRATPEEMYGPSLLSELAEVTGGRHFPVQNLNDLPDIGSKIGIQLRNQYVLGYRPTNEAEDGKWRKIRMKLNAPRGLPPLQVYAKSGYYAPEL